MGSHYHCVNRNADAVFHTPCSLQQFKSCLISIELYYTVVSGYTLYVRKSLASLKRVI